MPVHESSRPRQKTIGVLLLPGTESLRDQNQVAQLSPQVGGDLEAGLAQCRNVTEAPTAPDERGLRNVDPHIREAVVRHADRDQLAGSVRSFFVLGGWRRPLPGSEPVMAPPPKLRQEVLVTPCKKCDWSLNSPPQ